MIGVRINFGPTTTYREPARKEKPRAAEAGGGRRRVSVLPGEPRGVRAATRKKARNRTVTIASLLRSTAIRSDSLSGGDGTYVLKEALELAGSDRVL